MTWIKTINHEDAGPELKKLWDMPCESVGYTKL